MTDTFRKRLVGAEVLPTLHYVPDYISEEDEQRLLTEVHASQSKWVQLSGRRLQNHGGLVHTKGLIPTPMPRWLEQLCTRVHEQLPLFGDQGPNHVLINAYQPGCGIMPHQDGPLYHPVVCILSLGSPAVLRFWRKQPEGGTGGLPPVASILAMPRSLLIFQDEAYHDCLHGIEEVTEEAIDSSVVNLQALRPVQPATRTTHRTAAEAAARGGGGAASPSSPLAAAARQQEHPTQQPVGWADCSIGRMSCSSNSNTAPGPTSLSVPTTAAAAAARMGRKPVSGAAYGDGVHQQALEDCGGDNRNTGSHEDAAEPTLITAAAAQGGEGVSGADVCVCSDQHPFAIISRNGERVSLTIRRVLKVHRALGSILKRK